jgi:hypothetical protein
MAKSDHSQQGPSLKAAIFEVLDNQLRANDPPETQETLERLKAQATDEAEARRLIGCVIAAEIFAVLKTKERPVSSNGTENRRKGAPLITTSVLWPDTGEPSAG